MKKYIFYFLFLFIFIIIYGQWKEEYEMNDLDDLNTYATNDTLAFFYNDTLHIAGPDTFIIYIPVRYSYGGMHIHGTVTADDSLIHPDYGDTSTYSGGDTVYMDLAVNTGQGNRKADETETFYAMDSVKIASGTDSFEFWPMTNSYLRDRAGLYYSLRFRNTGGYGKFCFVVEYLNAMPKRY